MGLRLPGAIFFVLLIGTEATDVAVGQACTDADSCISNAACDKVHQKCLLKVGQTCTGGNEDNCVSGASCASTSCACGAGYTANSDVCVPKTPGNVGTSCTSESDCTTANSECSSLGACKCKDGFVINISNGECARAAGENGSTPGVASPLLLCLLLATTSIVVTINQ